MQRRWCHFLAACPIPSPRWRKTDSNHRSLSGRIPLFRLVLPAGGVEEACSEKPPVLGGDRQFESVFLHRRVRSELLPVGIATGRDAARNRGLRAPSRCSIEPGRLKWKSSAPSQGREPSGSVQPTTTNSSRFWHLT